MVFRTILVTATTVLLCSTAALAADPSATDESGTDGSDVTELARSADEENRAKFEALVESLDLAEPAAYHPVDCNRYRDTKYCEYYWEGWKARRAENYHTASRYFTAALRERPRSLDAIAALGTVISFFDYCDLAIPLLERGGHLVEQSFPLYRLGECYLDTRNYSRDASYVLHAVNVDRNNIWAQQLLIEFYANRDDWEAAQYYMRRFLEEADLESPDAKSVAAYWLASLGDIERAIEIQTASATFGSEERDDDPEEYYRASEALVDFILEARPEKAEQYQATVDAVGTPVSALRLRVAAAIAKEGWKEAAELFESERGALLPPEEVRALRRFGSELETIEASLSAACFRAVLRAGDPESASDCPGDITLEQSATLNAFTDDTKGLESDLLRAARARRYSLTKQIDDELRIREGSCGSIGRYLASIYRAGTGGRDSFSNGLYQAYWRLACGQKVSYSYNTSGKKRVDILTEATFIAGAYLHTNQPRKAHEVTSVLRPDDPPHFWVARMWTAAGVADAGEFTRAREFARKGRTWDHSWDLARVFLLMRSKEWTAAAGAFRDWLQHDFEVPAFSRDQGFAALLVLMSYEERPSLATEVVDALFKAENRRSREFRQLLTESGTRLAMDDSR